METYAQFIKDLEKNFLYEYFHLPFYGEGDLKPLHLRTFDIPPATMKNIRYICSIFDLDYPYAYYKEGISKGWDYNAILLWTATRLMQEFIDRYDRGDCNHLGIASDAFRDSSESIANEYEALLDDILLEKNYEMYYNIIRS